MISERGGIHNQAPGCESANNRRYASPVPVMRPAHHRAVLLSDPATCKETDDRVRATNARYAFVVLGAVLHATNLPHNVAAGWLVGPCAQRLCSQVGRVRLQVSWLVSRDAAFDAIDQPRNFLRAKEPDVSCQVGRIRQRRSVSVLRLHVCYLARVVSLWHGQLPRCPDHSRE